jgi:CubicO group peptidase (beta-lactamase class C family)
MTEVGWSLAVGHRGEVVHTECTGPHTSSTRFDLASTSKQFTALATLLTVVLDDEVWRLLHHESGLPDYIDLLTASGFGYLDRATTADALAVLDGAPLDFEPGTAWAYSNTNYFVLGRRVEEVTGRSLGEVLEDRVFAPLGLDMVMDPLDRHPENATSFDTDGNPADSPWEQVGDGAMWSTPSELVRWADSYSTAPFGAEVLDHQLTAVDTTDEDGDRYGAGIFLADVHGHRVLYHNGDWSGFESYFTVDPETRVAVALCANQPGVVTHLMAQDLLADWRDRLG